MLANNYLRDSKAIAEWCEISPRQARRIVQTGHASAPIRKLMRLYYDCRTLPTTGPWADWHLFYDVSVKETVLTSPTYGTLYIDRIQNFPRLYNELETLRRDRAGAAQYVLL